jgi:polyhydroxyalkanoate synthesis repressor PhaR
MGKKENQAEGPVLIKKYGNRRLYDTRQSRYITLEELAKVIQEGTHVRVVDSTGDKDITRQVLTQVILEQQDRLDMIPVDLLHLIIRTQGTLQQGPISTLLANITRQFTSTGTQWAQQMASLFGGFPGFTSGAGSPPPEPGTETESVPPPPDGSTKDTQEELDNLRSRMDDLLKSIGKNTK